MIRASALLLLVTACAGSPVEAAAIDGDGSGGASSTDHGSASTATGTTAGTNVDGGSDPSGAASGEATDPASTDPASDATEAQLSIDNTCNFDVEVFWVAYDCAEQSYQVISGGNDWSIQSFATHPWRIREADGGALLLEIPPLRGDTQITVQ